jgi:DNA-binding NarL/FixJ family response regulator
MEATLATFTTPELEQINTMAHNTETPDDDGIIKILLVDDHAVVRQGLRMFLALDPELQIIGEATNGAEAMEMSKQLKPNIILMDLLMPVMDGLTAIQKIKKAQPDVEIIALTSVIEDDRVYAAIQNGAMGYLMKDTQANELVQRIKAANRGEVQLGPEAARRLIREVRSPESPEKLTDRELEVLKLIAKGMSNKDIALRLVVSEKTVKTHVSNLLTKLSLPSRTQAALYALKEGLATLDGA